MAPAKKDGVHDHATESSNIYEDILAGKKRL